MKNFDAWNAIKKTLEHKQKIKYIHNGEVWMIFMGENVSTESSGVGDKFLRPVVIISRPRFEQVLVIPLSTKDSLDYVKLSFNYRGKDNFANILQAKVLDTARLHYKMGKISHEDLSLLKEKICEVVNSQI